MESSRKIVGGAALLTSLAMLATSKLARADEQYWPVSAPVYEERHPTPPPVTVTDPTLSNNNGRGGYTSVVQDSPQPDIFIMPTASVTATPTVTPAPATSAVVPVGAMEPTVALAPLNSSCNATTPSCDSTSAAACCCKCASMFDHKTGVFGEYLLLRAFDVDMAHGFQQNGVGGLGTTPQGDVGTAQPDFSSGFRVGADFACSCCSDISFAYTWYASSTNDLLNAAGGVGETAESLVLDPNSLTASQTFDSLFATYEIDFQTVDIDYNTLLCGTDTAKVNFVLGARYAHLVQDFSQDGEFSGATGSEFTTTHINFDGVGLRTGLKGEWQLGESRFAIYGRGFLNVLFGDFTSTYTQTDVTTSTVDATLHWVDGRVMPILETQVGFQWTSCSDCCKLMVGYESQYWFNAVDTAEFIQAEQARSFTRVGQTIAFTGLAARAVYQF